MHLRATRTPPPEYQHYHHHHHHHSQHHHHHNHHQNINMAATTATNVFEIATTTVCTSQLLSPSYKHAVGSQVWGMVSLAPEMERLLEEAKGSF